MERRTQARKPAELTVEHLTAETARLECDGIACHVVDLSVDGMRLSAPVEGWSIPALEQVKGASEGLLERARHAWVKVTLPDGGGPVRALVQSRNEGVDGTRGFFIKYIYPRDRRRYEAFVTSRLGHA